MRLLEREVFLAQLAGLLGDAGRGHGRLVLVSGEAGIGKTALVDAFMGAQARPGQALRGAYDAVAPARPFAPVVDMAAQVGGELRDALREGDKHRTCEAFLGLLRGPDAPPFVVFEDLQWVDEATLDLLRVVGRRLRTLPVLIIATYRDDEVRVAHPLRLALVTCRRARRRRSGCRPFRRPPSMSSPRGRAATLTRSTPRPAGTPSS